MRIELLEARIAPASVASLSTTGLNGQNGFIVAGEKTFRDYAGRALSAAGDVNGDGFDDFAIGADKGGGINDYHGTAYVIFGTDQGFPKTLKLVDLDGTDGFSITGPPGTFNLASRTGSSVSAAGDINGDGFDDLVIGSRSTPDGVGVVGPGHAYVVFGKNTAFAANLDLATMSAAEGFTITTPDNAGKEVSGAGDVNGDGLDDLVIGAYRTATGPAYVVFGRNTSFGTSLNVTALNGTNGFKITGASRAIASVSSGDINGDHISDLVLGAGAGYVIFGKNTAFTDTFDVSTLNGSNGFKVTAATTNNFLGVTISGESDINGDGFDDVVMSDSFVSPNGAAYVVFGKASGFTGSFSVTSLTGSAGFKISGNPDFSLQKVAAGGDFNGDGFDDFLVTSHLAFATKRNAGKTYVIFGRRTGFADNLDLTTVHGGTGFQLIGKPYSNTGYSADFIGDINGDGFDDFAAGWKSDPGQAFMFTVFGTGKLGITKDQHTATMFDDDGDTITVKVSKGTLAKTNFTLAAGGGLTALNLGSSFAGAGVTISATKVKGGSGDGTLSVDKINAPGIDLGAVTVKGRLEQIFAGNNTVDAKGKPVAAVKSLTVDQLGEASGVPGNAVDYHSAIAGPLGALAVKQNVLNAFLETTGATGAIGAVSIGGNLDGSGGGTSSGLLKSRGDIGAVKVKGSIIGGADFSGLIAGGKIGKVSVGAALTSANAAKPVTISALGKLGATKAADAVAIAGLSVKTDVLNARVLAGYDTSLAAVNPDAGIGAVTVGRDWTASSIAAGVKDTSVAGNLASVGDGFGQHDTRIAEPAPSAILATIASITVKGAASGSSTSTNDFFGVTAQRILKAKFGATVITLTTGAEDELIDATNNDFRLVDFA